MHELDACIWEIWTFSSENFYFLNEIKSGRFDQRKERKYSSERVDGQGKYRMTAEQYSGPFEDSDYEFKMSAVSCTGGINFG